MGDEILESSDSVRHARPLRHAKTAKFPGPIHLELGGSLPEVLGDAAGYHDPADSTALLAGMGAVLQDGGLRRERIEKGFLQAARYTWASSGAAVARLLEGLAR